MPTVWASFTSAVRSRLQARYAAAAAFGKNSYITSPEQPAFVKLPYELKLHAVDKYGNRLQAGGTKVEGKVIGASASACTVVDHKDGTYSLHFTVNQIGSYNVEVRVDGTKVKGAAGQTVTEANEAERRAKRSKAEKARRRAEEAAKAAKAAEPKVAWASADAAADANEPTTPTPPPPVPALPKRKSIADRKSVADASGASPAGQKGAAAKAAAAAKGATEAAEPTPAPAASKGPPLEVSDLTATI